MVLNMWSFYMEQVRWVVEQIMKMRIVVEYRSYCRVWTGAGGAGAGAGGEQMIAAIGGGRSKEEEDEGSFSDLSDAVEELPRPFRNLTVSRVVIMVSERASERVSGSLRKKTRVGFFRDVSNLLRERRNLMNPCS
jgi:hypothetical protein